MGAQPPPLIGHRLACLILASHVFIDVQKIKKTFSRYFYPSGTFFWEREKHLLFPKQGGGTPHRWCVAAELWLSFWIPGTVFHPASGDWVAAVPEPLGCVLAPRECAGQSIQHIRLPAHLPT